VVNKIIYYETHAYGQDWFNKMLTITGDGFGDFNYIDYSGEDPNYVQWEISDVPDGEYVIYAQSKDGFAPYTVGPIDEVHITIDRSSPSKISFGEDDHLKVEPLTKEQTTLYPCKPVAEIVVPQDGDVLGNTDVSYNPPEAYISDSTQWGMVDYKYSPYTEWLNIRVKAYTPHPGEYWFKPSVATWRVWINNSEGETIYQSGAGFNMLQSIYYEGETEVGAAINLFLQGSPFEQTKLWTSNGNWYKMWDVINEFSKGYGFVYFAGHGNPMSWGDHLPGIPGGRGPGMVNGLKNINLDLGWARYESEEGDPLFPMDQLTNGYMQPITIIGGCHNSMFDSSLMRLLMDPNKVLFTVLHGAWVPECFGWWLARMPQGGAIATIGNTGLGYGSYGPVGFLYVGGFVDTTFFKKYYLEGYDVLGETHIQTLIALVQESYHRKTFEEWTLLGDPSLKIGGYDLSSLDSLDVDDDIEIGDIELSGKNTISTKITNLHSENLYDLDWEIRIDSINPLARYFKLTGTKLGELFKGRILSGGYTTGHIDTLEPGETLDIASGSVFGLGHVAVNISVWDRHDPVDPFDDELLQYKLTTDTNMDGVPDIEEDGFLLGSRLLLYHGEE